jgi:hypothetical protein
LGWRLDMKIESFFSAGCGSIEKVKENIRKALLEEGMDAEVSFRELSQEEADKLGIGGSPTVRVNGQDVEPGTAPGGIS